MALAGQHEIVVAVQPDLARPAGHARRQRGQGRPGARLAFLAAETAAHASGFDGDEGVRNAKNARHDVLRFRRILARGVHGHLVAFARNGEGSLALEIEVLLAADRKPALELVRRRIDGGSGPAAGEGIVLLHALAGLQRVGDRQRRGLLLDLDPGEASRPPRLVARAGDHGEQRLPVKRDFPVREQGLVREDRRNVVLARNVRRRQDGDDSLGRADWRQDRGSSATRAPCRPCRRRHEASPPAHEDRRHRAPIPARAGGRNRAAAAYGRPMPAGRFRRRHSAAWRDPILVGTPAPPISIRAFSSRFVATSMRYAALARWSVSGVKSDLSAASAGRQRRGIVETGADQQPLRVRGSLRRRRHAAAGYARPDDAAAVNLDAHGQHDRGDILVEALRDFEGAEPLGLRQQRRLDRQNEFSRRPVLPAVADKEILQAAARAWPNPCAIRRARRER